MDQCAAPFVRSCFPERKIVFFCAQKTGVRLPRLDRRLFLLHNSPVLHSLATPNANKGTAKRRPAFQPRPAHSTTPIRTSSEHGCLSSDIPPTSWGLCGVRKGGRTERKGRAGSSSTGYHGYVCTPSHPAPAPPSAFLTPNWERIGTADPTRPGGCGRSPPLV